MCGICCILSTSSQARASLQSKLLPNLKKRGPDLSTAIESRVLCTRSSNKQGCCSPVRQSVCGSSDVKRQNESSFKESSELNSLDHSEHDLRNAWTKVEGQEKEHTCSLTGQRNDIPTIWDGSDESRSKTNVNPADSEDESIRRGCGEKLQPNCGCQSVYGSFFGQVLHLRGDSTPQPVQDEEGNILLWNGEIFDGIEVNGQNDTMVLSELLGGAKTSDDVVKVMGAIRGPWSFIYWQERNSRLWFGRDFFGRRSLLWLGDLSGPTMTFALSSVAHKTESAIPVALDWKEVPACGIFCLNVSSWGSATCKERYSEITWYPWQQPSSEHTVAPSSLKSGMNQDSNITDPTLPCGNQAVAASEEKSSMSPFDDILQCVLGECRLGNPISPLNMHIPDQTATSSCDSKARGVERTGERSGERTGDRDGEGVLNVSREVQEKAEELIRILGEAVRKRVTNVPVRTMALQNDRALQFQDQHGDKTHLDDSLKPCLLDMGVSCCEGEGDCEAAHRKEAERTNSKHENHLEGGFLDDVERGQIKPGHDASFQSLPTDPFHRCHDNHPVLSSYPSSFSNDRCQSAASESGTTDAPGVVSGMHAGNVCEQYGDLSCTTPSSSVVCCPHGPQEETESSRVGILFSGGLDSIVLAALADRYMPAGEPIDLFNVAFEQRTVAEQTKGKYKKKNSQELQKKSFDVPDRLTGRAGLGELQTLDPSRKWNFVEIDVTLEELQALRSAHLCHLIYPQDTVLDDSIGCAIWFAARGRGKLVTHNPLQGELLEESYTSPAKVVLVGMGADEQLAGYSRHRSKFKSEGWQGLLEEIKMEVDRISARNLGRDDRVISDHGRESRIPYLDEDVVSFLNSLPIHLKADLNLPRGVGEKLLLRVAAQQLGMGASSKLPKRAIQFGSRIAKLENNREKASDRCNRLEQKVD